MRLRNFSHKDLQRLYEEDEIVDLDLEDYH